MMRIFRHAVWGLVIVLGVMGAAAQDTPDADDRVRAALRQLAALDYRFNVTTETLQEYRMPESTDAVIQRQAIEGDSARRGDYSVNAALASVPQEAVDVEVTVTVSFIEQGGVRYMNVESQALGMFEIAEGWVRFDEVIADENDTLTAVYLRSLAQTIRPPHHNFATWIVMDASEQPADSLDGVPMRVYTFTVSPLSNFGQPVVEKSTVTMRVIIETLRGLWVGDFSSTYRLWIGEADGLPYRLEYTSTTFLPWFSRQLGTIPFDLYTDARGTLTFVYPDAPLEIRAPEGVQSLEE